MGVTDGNLIRRFRDTRDEGAFEELVRRHSGMVLGVCRRVLGAGEDAPETEDAFQGAFLVLATQAAKLRKSTSVASWLHGVALRVALKSKARAAARREHERRAAEMLKEDDSLEWRQTRGVIDEEVRRLPDRLRAPLVLCYFEEKTVEEAARDLGWTDGQLRGRLAKARDVLHSRLARRGVAVGAVALAALISQNASAAVPSSYVTSTVSAASAFAGGSTLAASEGASIAREVVQAMAAAKAKLVATVSGAAAVVAAGIVLGVTLGVTHAARPDANPAHPGTDGTDSAARTPAPVAVTPPSNDARTGAPEAADTDGARTLDAQPPGDEAAVEWGLPGPVARAVADICAARPGAEIRKVKRRVREGLDSYDIHIESGDGDCKAHIDADGTLHDFKEDVAAARLPGAVVAAVERLHPGAMIAHAEREIEGGVVRYDLEFDVGGDELDLLLAPDGEVLDDEGDEGDEEGDAEVDEEHGDEDADGGGAVRPEAESGEVPGGGVF